ASRRQRVRGPAVRTGAPHRVHAQHLRLLQAPPWAVVDSRVPPSQSDRRRPPLSAGACPRRRHRGRHVGRSRASQPGRPVIGEAFLFDDRRLAALAASEADRYRQARPFPHAVFDDFLPATIVGALVDEFPPAAASGWHHFESADERKLASTENIDVGPTAREVFGALNSSSFIGFLEQLTGISGLIPDPHFVGGGLHQIERGGFLPVHAAFNVHPLMRVYRRLNLLLYLNRDWDVSFGGHLELWEPDMSRCARRILPIANRCVVFDTGRRSLHGHPAPLACPEGWTRKSLALYYYTAAPAAAGTEHNT